MSLHHWGWVAFSGALLMVPPAAADPSGSSAAPVVQAAASVSAPNPTNAAAAVQAAISPGEIKSDTGAAPQPDGGSKPAALQVPAIEPEPPKPVITLEVDINLSSQRMTVTNEGEVIHSWPISSGRSGYYTPTGTYTPQWRAKMWRSKQYYGSPMPHSIFFHRGYAVHGTYATGMLGRPASHGCIRLAPKHAATLYSLVGKHGMESTKIVVHGKTPSTSRVARSRKSDRQEASRRRVYRGYADYGGAPFWMW